MNKIIINIILFFLFIGFLQAQPKGTLNYKVTIKNQFGDNEVNYIIYFNGRKSIELGVPTKQFSTTEKISETEIHETTVIKSKKQSFIYKDLRSKKLILGESIMFKEFLISDTLNNFKWTIMSEHKKILNYTCTKATVNFRGRKYTAWFTEDIPLQFGPWKFGGLPGLIVKVNDYEGKFDYELTGINLKAKFDDKIIQIPSEYIKDQFISHQHFIQILNKKIADYAKMSKVVHTSKDGSYGSVTIILPEKQEKF